MKKTVLVIQETRLQYLVETAPDESITDEQAIAITKARMEAQSPLGLILEGTKIISFEVVAAAAAPVL